jgi:hypothetical protein
MELDEALQHAADAIDNACTIARPNPYGRVRAALSDAQVAVHDAIRSKQESR